MVPDFPVPGDVAIDVEVDARYLACPLPLLKAKQAIQRLQAGQHARVLATDPGSQRDIRAWAEQSGHPLLAALETEGTFIYILRKRDT